MKAFSEWLQAEVLQTEKLIQKVQRKIEKKSYQYTKYNNYMLKQEHPSKKNQKGRM